VSENKNTIPMEEINASPTKNFFVEMLTRDIELEDAILDLLDNCVDGIQRTTKDIEPQVRPYSDFWARISFSKLGFKIEDNCGGIPIDVAERYAFRMGRPEEATSADKDVYTIGTYGIGMKRAIFKIGRSSEITSQTKNDTFKVEITRSWLNSDVSWKLPLHRLDPLPSENGTKIEVSDIREGINREFELSEKSRLHETLVGKISNHYNYILNKGFTIWVNEVKVPLTPLNLLWEGKENVFDKKTIAISPFLYKGEVDGVDIELAVGFYRPNATEEEVEAETKGIRRTSDAAGWTIICNDRVVVYCDKTRLTGWGEAKVPSYHPQFIAISGIVHFRSKDARSLPVTTTKRGIDSSSDIYLYVKDFMREGLKIFTSYTNKWKKNPREEKKISSKAHLATPNKIIEEIPDAVWTSIRTRDGATLSSVEGEKKYIPKLPTPKTLKNVDAVKMSFSRPEREVQIVTEYLFEEDSDRSPSEVAEECFSKVLREAER